MSLKNIMNAFRLAPVLRVAQTTKKIPSAARKELGAFQACPRVKCQSMSLGNRPPSGIKGHHIMLDLIFSKSSFMAPLPPFPADLLHEGPEACWPLANSQQSFSPNLAVNGPYTH